MTAYAIALVDVTDPDRYAEYIRLAPEAGAKFGVRTLARGGTTDFVEGDDRPGRVAVMEFESLETARAWYASAEYQAARQHRLGAADFRLIFVEGL